MLRATKRRLDRAARRRRPGGAAMKARMFVPMILAALVAVSASAESPGGKAAFETKCAACHGKDGQGETNYGKQRQIRDLASQEIQSESDEDLARHATECGKDVSPEEAKALVRVIRAFARKAVQAL